MKTAIEKMKNTNALYALLILLMVVLASPVMADSDSKSAKKKSKCTYQDYDSSCKKVKAKKHKRVSYGCKGKYKGKTLYRISKASCGVCPSGYKRNMLSKKGGPKACVDKSAPKDSKYKKMNKSIAAKCGKGQFKHKGYCKSCPGKGLKRIHVAGLDSGFCHVPAYKKAKKKKQKMDRQDREKERISNG